MKEKRFSKKTLKGTQADRVLAIRDAKKLEVAQQAALFGEYSRRLEALDVRSAAFADRPYHLLKSFKNGTSLCVMHLS